MNFLVSSLFFICFAAGLGAGFWLRGSRLKKNQRALSPNQVAARLRLSLGPHVVAVGGGTGLSSLLSGLKNYTTNLSAVVTVTDEGGSSGRLNRDWGLLPPGDIRNCMVALCEADDRLSELLDFRFDRGDLQGHSLGNLMLLAAAELTGDFNDAVLLMNRLLSLRGAVYPVTSEPVRLVATLKDGSQEWGELAVAQKGAHVAELRLEPQNPSPTSEALATLRGADMVCLGPGSLFTSVLPNLLVPTFAGALAQCKAKIVYVCNLVTQPGETDGLSAYDHIQWVGRALGRLPDFVVVNDEPLIPTVADHYAAVGAKALSITDDQVQLLGKEGCEVLRTPLVRVIAGNQARHHSGRLAEVLMRLARRGE